MYCSLPGNTEISPPHVTAQLRISMQGPGIILLFLLYFRLIVQQRLCCMENHISGEQKRKKSGNRRLASLSRSYWQVPSLSLWSVSTGRRQQVFCPCQLQTLLNHLRSLFPVNKSFQGKPQSTLLAAKTGGPLPPHQAQSSETTKFSSSEGGFSSCSPPHVGHHARRCLFECRVFYVLL